MSIRIALDNPPEFYTNLDFISGSVVLSLSRVEEVGNIIVKLEGEARTALSVSDDGREVGGFRKGGGNVVTESHKLLYKVQQVYPDEATMHAKANTPGGAGMANVLNPGQHQFRFRFKLPLNNICHDPEKMHSLGGFGGMGGLVAPGLLPGLGSFRVMDGTKQLLLSHVRATLPPSLTGFPGEAEIRYYIKVTIQRPGLFKENWRYQNGFKFLPIEPPRAVPTGQEAFARRPFEFRQQTPAPLKKRSSFFGNKPTARSPADAPPNAPPSFEMSARLPYPCILTCNEPLPLRLIAKKLVPVEARVFLTSLEIVLAGQTTVRVNQVRHVEHSRWVVVSATNVGIELGKARDPANTEFEIPNSIWKNQRLPNTVAPSFKTCNLGRSYQLEIRICLSWGVPGQSNALFSQNPLNQTLYLPLKFSNIEIFTGIKPPAELLNSFVNRPSHLGPRPPVPPPRPGAASNSAPVATPQDTDIYPPPLRPDQDVPPPDYAPPSYDEAMAESLTGPRERPAYSGVTSENAPSDVPEKSGMH